MTVREIKICCIQTRSEVEMSLAAGATALGFVARMPSGPGILEDTAIATLVASLPGHVSSFLLTSRSDPFDVVAHVRATGANTVQLCAPLPVIALELLRPLLAGTRIVQVVHVTGPESVDRAREVAPHVDAILLDSGAPSGPPGGGPAELGGTGRTHDWRIGRRIREAAGVPVFLAGGLDPTNIRAAIEAVGPHGVDLCSGIRIDGHLDRGHLHAFLREIRLAGDAP